MPRDQERDDPKDRDPERFRDGAKDWARALSEAKPFRGPIPRLRKPQRPDKMPRADSD